MRTSAGKRVKHVAAPSRSGVAAGWVKEGVLPFFPWCRDLLMQSMSKDHSAWSFTYRVWLWIGVVSPRSICEGPILNMGSGYFSVSLRQPLLLSEDFKLFYFFIFFIHISCSLISLKNKLI
jgi:hypothetical protein